MAGMSDVGLPTTSPAGVRLAYDVVAADYARHLPDLRAEAALDRAVIDDFADRVAETSTPTVLDAGCGTGRVGRVLRARGLRVVGVDLSPGMLREATAGDREIVCAAASLTHLPLADGSVDGVLLWYSLIHLGPDLVPVAVREAARVLRPGGHVLVGFQAGAGSRDVAPSYRRLGHEVTLVRHLLDVDSVAGELARAGLVEEARVVRRGQGTERDDQAMVLARSDADSSAP